MKNTNTLKIIMTLLLSFCMLISNGQNFKEINSITVENNQITAVNISPDNQFVICGFSDGDIIAYKTVSGKKVYETKRHQNIIHSISFNKTGKYFVSAGQDRAAVVWSVATGKQLKTFYGGDAVWTAEFTPNGKYLVTGGTDQVISIWELVSGQRYRTLWGHKNRVYDLKITADGKYVISVSGDRTMKKWDISKQLQVKSVHAHENDVTSVAISADQKYVVTASKDNTVKIWDFDTFNNIALMRGHQWWINKVVISPDSKYIASGADDNTVIIWDLEAHEKIKTLKHDSPVLDLAFSKDGKYLVSCDAHKIRIFTTGFPALSN
ncbi:MAG: WD40 repeat domain-containing protein [Chlorobi bacterium]|nr:WD40 repeat domain-containing protein [Chlorobiota bacterium]